MTWVLPLIQSFFSPNMWTLSLETFTISFISYSWSLALSDDVVIFLFHTFITSRVDRCCSIPVGLPLGGLVATWLSPMLGPSGSFLNLPLSLYTAFAACDPVDILPHCLSLHSWLYPILPTNAIFFCPMSNFEVHRVLHYVSRACLATY